MKDIKQIFSENLNFLMEQKRENLTSLSNSLDISFSTVSDWKKGKKMPRSGALQALAEHYNVNVSYLTTDREQLTVVHQTSNTDFYDFFDVGIAAGAIEQIDRTYLEDDDIEQIEIADEILGKYAGRMDIFFTRINGDSMNKIIPDHSLIAVKRIEEVEDFSNDDLILFSYQNGFSVKRFFNDSDSKQLIFSPESKRRDFHDIVVPYEFASDLKILGKVVMYIVNLD